MYRIFFYALVLSGTVMAFPVVSKAQSRDRQEWVKYAQTPEAVQRTIDRERRNHDIKRIDRVWRDDREFYRVTIDTRGGEDLVVRIDPSGRVLSRDEARDIDFDRGRAGTDRGRADTERAIRYANLPERVKETLDRERGRLDIKELYEVNRDGRVFYRAIINEQRGDRMIRISEGGRLLSEQDIADTARPAGGRFDPRFDERGNRREYGEPREIAYNHLPGDVKTTLGREAGAEKVTRVTEYRSRDGYTVYRAEISGPTRTRVVRVDADGRTLGDRETTDSGKRFVRYDDLPGEVKQTIGQEVPRGRLGDVVQITREGRTYYRAEIDEGAWSRWLTISDNGRIIGEITRPDNDRR